jgi:hypothetical protein
VPKMSNANLQDSSESRPGGAAEPATSSPQEPQAVRAVKGGGRPESHAASAIDRAVRPEYTHAIVGLSLGLFSLVVGLVLCLHGAAESVTWTAPFLGSKSSLNHAGTESRFASSDSL